MSYLDGLTPDTAAAVLELQRRAADAGIRTQLRSGLRTCAEQNAIYAQGRTTPGDIVTRAPGCKSWHVLGRAADLNVLDANGAVRQDQAAYEALAAIAEPMGFSWGGRFVGFWDGGHFSWNGKMTIDSMCPNPDDCEAALARSRAVNIPLPGSSGAKYVALAVGILAGAGVVLWSRR